MASGFLIMRILLVCLLSEVNYSLAFPRGESFLRPKSWQGGGVEPQELLGYGNRHPFQSVQSLRVSPRSWRPSVPHDEVNPRGPKPLGRFLGAPRSAQVQNTPSFHVDSRWQQGTSPPLRNYLPMQPRTLALKLKVPFTGSGALYRPTSFQVQTMFNNPDKGSYNPDKPSFEGGFTVPITYD